MTTPVPPSMMIWPAGVVQAAMPAAMPVAAPPDVDATGAAQVLAQEKTQGTTQAAPPVVDATTVIVDLDAGGGFGFVEHDLDRPFRLNGAVHEKIRVRIPTGRELRGFYSREGSADERAMATMVDLTGLSEAALMGMAGSDYARVDKIVGEFLAGARATPTA